MINTIYKLDLRNQIDTMKSTARSAWMRGALDYADELLDDLPDVIYVHGWDDLERVLLNGARDWREYSEGGCALIYDNDIAERLSTPSELRRNRGGDLPPNGRETWLDVQARALRQAAYCLHEVYHRLAYGE